MELDIRSPEYRSNPYPFYRRLRAEAPVCRITPHGHWAIARHADVLAILRNPKLFSSESSGSEPLEGPEFLLQSRGLVGFDPPRHTRLRALVSKAFTPLTVASLETRVREITRRLLSPLRSSETFELVRQFSMPLPVIVISELLGIDPERRADFQRWSNTLITWRNGSASEARREAEAMHAYFASVIAARSENRREDLISALVRASEDEERLTAREVLGFVRLLLVAGNETTTNLIGNTLLALLSHPDEWRRTKADRARLPALVEESLRFDSPVLSLSRCASDDTEIAGVRIARGELVLPLLASANHDERVFEASDRFLVERSAKGHLAFGEGIHYCMGAPLARLQARVALEEIFEAFGTLERAGDEPLMYLDSFFFRGVRRLILKTR